MPKMQEKKSFSAAIGMVVTVVALLAVMCGVILSSPLEIVKKTAGNFMGDIMNGGRVLEDEKFLFYVNDSGKLYRAETNHTDQKPVLIAENCEGYIQVLGNDYYFVQNGDLVSCDYDGNNLHTVLKNVKKPMVVGSMIYYLNENGEIVKYSERYNNITNLKIKPKGEFAVYYSRIYYVGDDSLVHSCAGDGSDDKIFFDQKVDKFVIDSQFFFYTYNGAFYSALKTDNGMTSTKITSADSFYAIIDGGKALYTNKDGVFYADLNEMTEQGKKYKPKKMSDNKNTLAYGDDKYFYWFESDGNIARIGKDGKNQFKFIAE